MTDQLFRQEVLSQQQGRFWGSSAGLCPPAMTIFSVLLLLVFVSISWFLWQAEYLRKEMVAGLIVPENGVVKISSPASGSLESLMIAQGQQVAKGTVLLEIKSSGSVLDGLDLSGKLITENERQGAILRKLIRQQGELYPVKLDRLEAEIKSLEKKLQQLMTLVENEEALSLLQQMRFKRLNKQQHSKYLSLSVIENARMEMLRQENLLQQARLELENCKQLIQASRYEEKLVRQEYRQQLANFKKQLSELRMQNLQLNADQSFHVLSPVTGTVSILYSQQGQIVMEQQPLLAILPDDSVLEAELYIPSRAVGFLEPGLQVSLRLDAFPYQKFGTLNARIKAISQTVLMPDDNQHTRNINEPYYKVLASVEKPYINAYGKQLPLRPGMQLNGNIMLESRNLIEWLLQPLFIRKGLN